MKTIELSPMVAEAAKWMEEAIGATDFGEVSVVVKLHAGRVPIVQYHRTESVKTTEPHAGSTGGRHVHTKK